MKRSSLPIVEAYVLGDYKRIHAIAARTKPSDPMLKYYDVLTAFSQINRGVSGPAETYTRLTQVLNTPPPDVELFAIMLRVAVLTMVNLNRLAEAQRTMRLLKQLDQREIRKDLFLQCTAAAESCIHLGAGDWEKSFETLDSALQQGLPRGSVIWYRLKVDHLHFAIMTDRIPVAINDLKEISEFPKLESVLLVPIAYHRAWVQNNCGNYDKAVAILDDIPPKTVEAMKSQYIQLRIILLTCADRLHEASVLLLQSKEQMNPPVFECMQGILALARHDLVAARKSFRFTIARSASESPYNLRNAAQLLAEVELSDCQPDAARKILTFLDKDQALPALGILWARLHLLEKNSAQAAVQFKRVLDRSGKDFINHAFRFAYEVSASDLARLFAAADRGSSEKRSKSHSRILKAAEGHPLVGATPAIRDLKIRIAQFAGIAGTVLITGETGVGKEVVAHALHQLGPHANEPFLAVNSGAISDTLIESELFGYADGAFTGAVGNQDGLFVAAGRGTIFLDEIEAMSPRMQAALLRVLEEREVRPVGSTRPRPVQARVIVASNQALEEAIESKTFRADLFFRISRLHVHIPPLRERKEDIPLLAEYFLAKAYGDRSFHVSEELSRAMMQHSWPGNVRELKNKVELMALLAGDATDLTAEMFTSQLKPGPVPPAPDRLEPETRSKPVASAPADRASPLMADRSGRYAQWRLDQLRVLFSEHKKLTRAEVVRLLDCSPGTATHDLQLLESRGLIRRICPTPSLRTSYFVECGDEKS